MADQTRNSETAADPFTPCDARSYTGEQTRLPLPTVRIIPAVESPRLVAAPGPTVRRSRFRMSGTPFLAQNALWR